MDYRSQLPPSPSYYGAVESGTSPPPAPFLPGGILGDVEEEEIDIADSLDNKLRIDEIRNRVSPRKPPNLPPRQQIAEETPTSPLASDYQARHSGITKPEFAPTVASLRPKPLTACPTGPHGLGFSTHWYHPIGNPDFWICTKCYEEELRETLVENDFYSVVAPAGPRWCMFNVERVKKLLEQAKISHEFKDLKSFMEYRGKLKPCPGFQDGAGTDAGIRWYSPATDEMGLFVSCEACYQDLILATGFSNHWSTSRYVQPAGSNWRCGLAFPFIARAMKTHAGNGSWDNFVKDAILRVNAPPCTGAKHVPGSSRKWFKPINQISDLSFCEACYLDHVGLTLGASRFDQFSPAMAQNLQFACDNSIMPMAIAVSVIVDGKFDLFHSAATTIMSSPKCSPGGIKDGVWYTLKDGDSEVEQNFAICSACYAGWGQAAEHEQIYRPVRYPPGVTIVCDLCPGTARFIAYKDKYLEMVFTGEDERFTDYVKMIAPLPVCPKIDEARGRRWYGSSSLLICPTCYMEVVKGTSLASQLPYQNTLIATSATCDMFSLRMRSKWAEAVAKGSLDDLLNFAAHRAEVYQATVPEMRQIVELQKMRLQQAEFYNSASSAYNNMNGIASIGSNVWYDYGGVRYGSTFGATGAEYARQATAMEGQISDPALLMRVRHLQKMWDDVQ